MMALGIPRAKEPIKIACRACKEVPRNGVLKVFGGYLVCRACAQTLKAQQAPHILRTLMALMPGKR